MIRSQNKSFFCAFFFFLLFSHTEISARKKIDLVEFSNISWTKLSNADYFCSKDKNVHILRIDLKSPKMKVVAYPSVTDSDAVTDAGFLDGVMLSQFVWKSGAKIAINTSPYWINTDFTSNEPSKKLKILGIHVAEKMQFSKPLEKYPAFVMYKTLLGYRAKIVPNQEAEKFTDADFVFGGYFQILSGGKKITFLSENFDSRTAVGLTSSGDEIFILVCKKNPGLSFQECQTIFQSIGCIDALEFDGGSSTSLFLKSKEKNIKIQSFLRVNASYMGFLFDD